MIRALLQADVFAHGQLYVAVSRARRRADVRVFSFAERIFEGDVYALNIVFEELIVRSSPSPLLH